MKLNTAPLSGIELGTPVIQEGVYHASIRAELKPNKSGDGHNLNLSAKVLDSPVYLFDDGKEIENKGQVMVFRTMSLKATEKYDPNKNLKELAVAIGLGAEDDLNIEDLQDKTVMIKVSHRGAETDPSSGRTYKARNEIDRFSPVSEDDPFEAPPF